MIFDINAYIGHYPFMQLRHSSPEQLVALMDRNGIDRAAISSLQALFYRDVHRGNDELRQAVEAHPGRLIPLATINPTYAGWQRDLEQAIHEWKMRGICLAPSHHGYSLSDKEGQAVLRRASRLGVPVALSQRYEDRRQRHAWDQAEDLRFGDVAVAIRNFPDLKVLFVNWIGLESANLQAAGLQGRCLIDFARMQVVHRASVPRLIDVLGVEAVAFGSHMPFNYVTPSLIKMAVLDDLSAEEREKIAWKNAASFLGLSGGD